MSKQKQNAGTYLLTVDVGTTAVKVCLFDGRFSLKQMALREYALDSRPGDVVEVEPGLYLQAVESAIAEVTGGSPGCPVAAIAVTTQGETLIPVDAAGQPLCNAIVWLDSRATGQADELSQAIDGDLFYQATGLPAISAGLPLAKLLYLRQEHPAIYGKAHKFLLLEDFLLHWLTGRFVTEKSLLCSTGYFNIIDDDYWDFALQAAGVDPAKLPQALGCGEPVGPLLPERAAQLNLPHKVLVVTGAMDQIAAALAAGCVAEGIVTETTGTALVVAAHTDTPCFSHKSRVTIYRHAIDGAYLYLPIGITAGMALKWFRDQFCQDLTSQSGGIVSYDAMGAMAAAVPAGSDGLLALPHLAGCINPDFLPDARLVFYGAALETTRAHFIRAIMESVAYNLKDFVAMLEELGGAVTEIRSLGGGSYSSLWLQIKADVTGIPICTMDPPEAASVGAALLAAWGLGLVPRNTALPVMAPRRQYRPDEANTETYRRCYQRYLELYRAIKPLYEPNGRDCNA